MQLIMSALTGEYANYSEIIYHNLREEMITI